MKNNFCTNIEKKFGKSVFHNIVHKITNTFESSKCTKNKNKATNISEGILCQISTKSIQHTVRYVEKFIQDRWLFKLSLVFSSIIISGFSLLEMHYQDFHSLLDMHVFRNGDSFSTRGGVRCFYVDSTLLHRSFSTSISAPRSLWTLPIHGLM
jgi:hypothetical protein